MGSGKPTAGVVRCLEKLASERLSGGWHLAYMEAEKIVEAILDELKDFTTGVQPEDDITLVVMRVKDETT